MSSIEINIKVSIDDKDIAKALEFAEEYEKFHKIMNSQKEKKVNENQEPQMTYTNKGE